MDKKPLFSKYLAIGIILLFVGTCIIPVTAQTITKSDVVPSIIIHKIFFVGTLDNYTINDTEFHFISHNLRVLEFELSPGGWGFSYHHYKSVDFNYIGGEINFHGILRPHFILGWLG